jgi:hypothetical protein
LAQADAISTLARTAMVAKRDSFIDMVSLVEIDCVAILPTGTNPD